MSDLLTIKVSQIVESSDWSECLVRMPEMLERAVNRGIGSFLWLSALVNGVAANALENQSCVTGCIRDLLGSRNLLVVGRPLRGGEGPSLMFRSLCHGFVDKRFVASDIEGVAKQFGGHGPQFSGVWWLTGMGIGIGLTN